MLLQGPSILTIQPIHECARVIPDTEDQDHPSTKFCTHLAVPFYIIQHRLTEDNNILTGQKFLTETCVKFDADGAPILSFAEGYQKGKAG